MGIEFPAGKRSCLLRLPIRKERERGEGGGGGGRVPAIDPNVGGVLTIYTNNLGENLVQKFKTIRFDVVGERPAQSIPNSALQIE